MDTSTISASTWYQGQYDASTDTYDGSVYYISTSRIVIPVGSQTLKFSGEGSQVVLVNRWVGRTEEGQRVAYIDWSAYQSDAVRISYKLLDSSGAQLTYGTIRYNGSTSDISAYPQAKYVVISINIETSSYSYPIIIPGETTEIKRMIVEDGRSRVYELANEPEFALDHYVWHERADGPHSDDAPVYPEDIAPPWPDGVWRIEEYYNNGFPFTRLMPNIPYDPPPPEPDTESPTVVQYDIYCDDKLMHSSISPDNAFKVIDPVLDLQDSAAGSLEFGLPPFNTMYGQMLMVASTIRVERNGEEIWEGRPVSFKEDMWLNHNVTCEGELAYLNDVYQVQAKYENVTLTQLLWAIIGVNEHGIDITKGYNQRAAENRRFDIGSVTAPKYEVDTLTFTVPFDSTLNVVNNICKEYGLHVYVEKHDGVRTLIFTGEDSPRGENITQKIEFGTNLIEYAKSYNFAELVTAVLPLGAKSDKAGKVVVAKDEHGINIEMTPTPYGTPENHGRGFVIWPVDDDYHNAGDIVYVGSVEEGMRYFVYEYTVTKDKSTVFITDQNNLSFAMACVKYTDEQQHTTTYYLKKAKGGSTMTVWTETKYPAWYNMFPDNAEIKIYVGGYDSTSTSGVPTGIAVYESKVVDEGMEDYTTVESVNYWYDSDNQRQNDGYWVIDHESNTIDIYGRIERKVEWSSVKDAQTLYNNAIEYLRSGQFDGMQITLTAFDMAILGAKNTNVLRVGENVHCIAPPYGLDSLMPITEIKIPLSKPEDTKFTVGDKRKQNLTSVNSSTNSELLAMIAEKPSVSAVLSAAKRSAAEYITDTRNSYVTYRYGTKGETQAIIISDSEDYTQSTNGYWILGDHGIGYVRAGHSEATEYTDATVAMTKDGKIVADYITTGFMFADRIQGGTLKLGGFVRSDGTAVNGHLEVVDGSNGKMLRFGYIDPSTGLDKYSDGLEIMPISRITEGNVTYGHWGTLRDGRLYFGEWNFDSQQVVDGYNWDTRPQIGAVSTGHDSDFCRSIGILNAEHIVIDGVGGFAIRATIGGVSDTYPCMTGVNTVNVGNQQLVFIKGILAQQSSIGDSYPSGDFTIDHKHYHYTHGIITSVTEDEPEPSNNE